MPLDKYSHITDNELLNYYYKERDNKWLGILLQRYTLLLLGTCMKYLKNEEEARDSVQQIFLKSITELEKYKVDYFKSWIYMVAKNYCLMKLRDKNIFVDADEQKHLTAEETSKTVFEEREKNIAVVEESIQQLNSEQQSCVTLFYLQKQSYQQIADKTGFSLMQVKSYIQNGKRNLKLIIEKKQKHLNE